MFGIRVMPINEWRNPQKDMNKNICACVSWLWLHPQAVGLLQHLSSYKRISPPTELESSYLLEHGLEPTPLAHSRLPFHILFQTGRCFWKIISEYRTLGSRCGSETLRH